MHTTNPKEKYINKHIEPVDKTNNNNNKCITADLLCSKVSIRHGSNLWCNQQHSLSAVNAASRKSAGG